MSNDQQMSNIIELAIKLGQHKPSAPVGDIARNLGKLRKLAHSLWKRRGVEQQDDTFKDITAHLEGRVKGLAYLLGVRCEIVAGDYPVKLTINGTDHWVY